MIEFEFSNHGKKKAGKKVCLHNEGGVVRISFGTDKDKNGNGDGNFNFSVVVAVPVVTSETRY